LHAFNNILEKFANNLQCRKSLSYLYIDLRGILSHLVLDGFLSVISVHPIEGSMLLNWGL
jgi:hypothetical protein